MSTSEHPEDRADQGTNVSVQPAPFPGVVAGTVLRVARCSAGLSATRLAAAAGVSESTVRSWEDGSSPLAYEPIHQIERIENELQAADADQQFIADIAVAAWCDVVLQNLADGDDTDCLLADPLAHEAIFGELLIWSIADQPPARYRDRAEPRRLLPIVGLDLIAAVMAALNALQPSAWPACFANQTQTAECHSFDGRQ